jgi:hypothetical protein
VPLNGQSEHLERASLAYAEQLKRRCAGSDGAIAYFKAHGVTPDMAEAYRLGLVSVPEKGDEMFISRLSIPYLTRNGVVSVKFRRLTEHGKKYLYPSGTKHRLYNTEAWFTAEDTIGLAEGEIDAIVATSVLGVPTMGIPGVESWEGQAKIWVPILTDFQRVVVFADGDPLNPVTDERPGRKLAEAIKEALTWRVQVIEMPEGDDVSSVVARGDADWIRGKL